MKWKKVGGKGRWENWKNLDTGEETVKEHKLKVVWTGCKKHNFVLDGRTVVCKKCGLGKMFNPAKQELRKGQLINKE